MVRVRLRQACILIPVGVYRRNQGDSRRQLSLPVRVDLIPLAPLTPPMVGAVELALVDHDPPLVQLELLEHRLRVQASQNQAAVGVASEGHNLDPPIPQANLVAQDLADEVAFDFNI